MTKPKTPQIRFQGFTDEWEEKVLGEIFSYLNNKTLSRADLNYDNGVVMNIHYGDILIKFGECLDVSVEQLPYITESKGLGKYDTLQSGDIVFADTAEDETAGKCVEVLNIEDEIIISGSHTIACHPLISFAKGYLGYFLNAPIYHNQLLTLMQGTKVIGISKTALRSTLIYHPDKEEQKLIYNYFQKIDDLIAKTRNKLDKLKNMKQACLSKMFPQQGATTPQIRFSGFAEEWEEKMFSELYQKINEKNDLRYATDKIISVANMYFKSDIYISNKEYLKTYNIFKLGDIAFEGNKSKSFTHGRFVENSIGDGIVSHVFDVFRPITKYNLNFWKYAINNDLLMKNILIRSTKSSTMMTNLVADDFLKESFLVPSIQEQTQIGNFFKNLDNLIALNQKQLGKLQNIKVSCFDKMFVNNG